MPRDGDGSTSCESAQDPFIGRGGELTVLKQQLEAAHGGRAQLTVIDGIAGVGKSSLIERFLRDIGDGSIVLRAWGNEERKDTAYSTISELIAQVPERVRAVVPGLPATGDPATVGGWLLSILDDIHEDRGTVIITIDDAHIADTASARALMFFARRLLADRVMVVCTSRLDELPAVWAPFLESTNCRRLTLNGFDADELSELASAVGVTLSKREAMQLRAETDGHPLYARTLIAAEILDLQLSWSSGQAPPAPPPDLGRLVVSALDKCAEDTKSLVAAVAVLGRLTSLADAVWLGDVDDGAPAVEEALGARLLVEVPGSDGRYVEPAHPLVHAAVYEHLGPSRRRSLHARAAAISGGPSRLWHLFVAAVGSDEQLAVELETVAESERQRGDFVAAGEHLRQAAAVSLSGPSGQRRILDATTAFLVAGEADKARSMERQIQNVSPGPYRDYVVGYLALVSGRMGEATALFRKAWDDVRGGTEFVGPVDLAGRLASQLTILSVLDLRLEEIRQWSAAALATAEADEPSASFAWFARAFGMGATGHSEAAFETLKSVDAPKGVDVAIGRGMMNLWSDDLIGAREELRAAYAKARSGEPLRMTQGVAFLGETEYRLGNLDEAVLVLELAVEAMEDGGRVWDFPVVHALASYPHAARGNFNRAELHVAAAAAWSELVPVAASRAYAAGARVALALARSDPQELLLAARAMYAAYPGYEPGTNVFGPVLAEALLGLGRLEQAAAELDRFEQQATKVGRRSALLGVARVRGCLAAEQGNFNGAADQFSIGEGLAAGLDLPLETARLHAAHGHALLLAGNTEGSQERLKQSFDSFQQIGAAPYAARVATELAGLGALPPERRLPELTPSEGAVARLVAEGLSNRLIAAELVISVKTVEFHLSNIYRRLGISSRTRLTRLLVEGQV